MRQGTLTLFLACPLLGPVMADQKAKTQDGRTVLLKDDGTWKYTEVFQVGDKGVTVPRILRQTMPQFPKSALTQDHHATVVLSCIVRASGRAEECRALPGAAPDLMRSAVWEITQNWRFKPATFHKRPVDMRVKFEIDFSRTR